MSVFFGWLVWGLYTLWAIWSLASHFLQNPHGGIQDKVSRILMNWNSLLMVGDVPPVSVLWLEQVSLVVGAPGAGNHFRVQRQGH